MRIGSLGLLNRTNSEDTFNLASWHSPHSLTWRWILSVHRQPFAWPRPFALVNSVGLGAGFGQLLSFHVYRTNNGPQFSFSLLWHSLSFSQQRPMWFKDMVRRHWNEAEELKHENWVLRRELGDAQFLAARQGNNEHNERLN